MNVVVIDDDGAFLRSMEILLSCHGHRVMCFKDPADARFFLKMGQSVDVLLLDYEMPSFNGTDLLDGVRSDLPRDCRIVMISGHTDHIETLDLDEIGVHMFLPKPLDYLKLLGLVDPGSTNGKNQKATKGKRRNIGKTKSGRIG